MKARSTNIACESALCNLLMSWYLRMVSRQPGPMVWSDKFHLMWKKWPISGTASKSVGAGTWRGLKLRNNSKRVKKRRKLDFDSRLTLKKKSKRMKKKTTKVYNHVTAVHNVILSYCWASPPSVDVMWGFPTLERPCSSLPTKYTVVQRHRDWEFSFNNFQTIKTTRNFEIKYISNPLR